MFLNNCRKKFKNITGRSTHEIIIMTEPTAKELLHLLETKLETGQYTDSVHKIKLMTTRDVVQKILATEF